MFKKLPAKSSDFQEEESVRKQICSSSMGEVKLINVHLITRRLSFGSKLLHSRFSRVVTAAMLVSPINPPATEFYSYANAFFCFG